MLGAIIGDTIGSIYEFNNIKTTEFPLFSEGSGPTDDSFLSIACITEARKRIPEEFWPIINEIKGIV